MLNPPGCQCSICRDCLQHHFEIVIRERYVRNMVCPVCSQPDIDNSQQTDTHFQLLSIMVTYSLQLPLYRMKYSELILYRLATHLIVVVLALLVGVTDLLKKA